MIVCGLDPGTEQSAFCVLLADNEVGYHSIRPNADILAWLEANRDPKNHRERTVLVIEQVESFGMPVGREVFETVFWTGRFAQMWNASGAEFDRLPRRLIKQHLCHTARATDANIRQALIDRFGPGKDKAVGLKSSPGPLFGVKSHEIAALAVAVTWADQNAQP